LIGEGQTISRTPCPVALPRRLRSRTHVRTSLLTCQEALSHTSSKARLSRTAASWQHQSRKTVVTALTGRPSRQRSQTSFVLGSQMP
jgi:hypothetical protein